MKPFIVSVMCLIFLTCSSSDNSDDNNSHFISDNARAFADAHWIVEKYNDKRYDSDQNVEVPSSNASWYGWWEEWYTAWALDPLENELTHSLPEIEDEEGTFIGWNKNDDYYKMIGEIDQFVYGWDDVHDHLLPGDSTLSPKRYLIIWGESGIDTAYFETWIGEVISGRRLEYLDLLESSKTSTSNPLKH